MKSRLTFTPEQRDRILILLLVILGLLAFPLLGSILTNQDAPVSTPAALPSVAAGVPATETPAPSPTLAPSTAAAAVPATSSPTVAAATPTLPARVYLQPFRQVFTAEPTAGLYSAPSLLYENGSDVFQVMERQGNYLRVQTLNGARSLWTAEQNISLSPPSAPQYDFSVRGRKVQLAGAAGLACLHQGNASPPLDPCESLFGITNATLTARITSGPVSLYLADVNGKTYYLLPEAGTL